MYELGCQWLVLQVLIDRYVVFVGIVPRTVLHALECHFIVNDIHGEVFPEGDTHLVVGDTVLYEVPDVGIFPGALGLPLGDELSVH